MVSVEHVFSKIISALSTQHFSVESHLAGYGKAQAPTILHSNGNYDHTPQRRNITSGNKRSARIRSKKVKLLGLSDNSLKPDDLLFINDLTPGQIMAIGSKYGLLFSKGDRTSINELKRLELSRYSSLIANYGK